MSCCGNEERHKHRNLTEEKDLLKGLTELRGRCAALRPWWKMSATALIF